MPLKVQISNTKYENATEGIHPAVLADVVDLGIVEGKFGKKDKGKFVFFIEECDTEGKQKMLSTSFTKSLNAKSTLTKLLKQLGVKVEGEEIDVEIVLGKQVQLMVTHSDGQGENAGKTYANISGISKAQMGQAVPVPDGFQRVKDR